MKGISNLSRYSAEVGVISGQLGLGVQHSAGTKRVSNHLGLGPGFGYQLRLGCLQSAENQGISNELGFKVSAISWDSGCNNQLGFQSFTNQLGLRLSANSWDWCQHPGRIQCVSNQLDPQFSNRQRFRVSATSWVQDINNKLGIKVSAIRRGSGYEQSAGIQGVSNPLRFRVSAVIWDSGCQQSVEIRGVSNQLGRRV